MQDRAAQRLECRSCVEGSTIHMMIYDDILLCYADDYIMVNDDNDTDDNNNNKDNCPDFLYKNGSFSMQESLHLEQLVWSIGRSYTQLLEQLDQETAKALECARKAHLGVHLNQHIFPGVDVQGLHGSTLQSETAPKFKTNAPKGGACMAALQSQYCAEPVRNKAALHPDNHRQAPMEPILQYRLQYGLHGCLAVIVWYHAAWFQTGSVQFRHKSAGSSLLRTLAASTCT